MTDVHARIAEKADRALLESFCCTTKDGPEWERVVQRFFRVFALKFAGSPAGIARDARTLLVFDGKELVACGLHAAGTDWPRDGRSSRHLAYGAVALDRRGSGGAALSNGGRASEALWEVLVRDAVDRPSGRPTVLWGRVHRLNRSSRDFCERHGLLPVEELERDLILYAGPVPD